jgi:flagellin
MTVSIYTNVPSLTAQRNLNQTQNSLATSITRLSSGLRINSAKDDAAGIAIATRETVQIQGLTVAIRNANDGISISQTAEGAMDEMSKNLIRMNDLAIQSASYNTDADRSSLNEEVQQLIAELGRTVDQTRFNGQQLLNGGFSAAIQVGTKVNETININVSDLSTGSLGISSNYEAVTQESSGDFANAMYAQTTQATLTTTTLNSTVIANADGSAFSAYTDSLDKINRINAISGETGIQAFSYGNGLVSTTGVATGTTDDVSADTLSINGVDIDISGLTTGSIDDVATQINAKSAESGVTATVVEDTTDFLVLTNTNGAAITMNVGGADIAALIGYSNGSNSVSAGQNGRIVFSGELGATLDFSTGEGDSFGSVSTGTITADDSVTLTDRTLNEVDISTVDGANLALLIFEGALDTINSDRATLGAQQNRFESTIRSLEITRENTVAARGRLVDADFAEETANLARQQILQQAGVAMVAQANQSPQIALALLQ